MKRRDLEKHLTQHGCELARHGANHDIWLNPATDLEAPLPRHKEVKWPLARSICERLDVPAPSRG